MKILTPGITAAGATTISRTRAVQTFSNAAVTVDPATDCLLQIGTMSASRVVTLPAASAYPAGFALTIEDKSGTVTTANSLVLTRAGSDTINGGTTLTLITAYTGVLLVSDGTSAWTCAKMDASATQRLSPYLTGAQISLADMTTLRSRRISLPFGGANWSVTAGGQNVKNELLQLFPGATTSAYSLRAYHDATQRVAWQLGQSTNVINWSKGFLIESEFFANSMAGNHVARIVMGKNSSSTTQGRGTGVGEYTAGAEVIVNGANLNVRIFGSNNNTDSVGGAVYSYTNSGIKIKIGVHNDGAGTGTLYINDTAVTTCTFPTATGTAGRVGLHVEADNAGTANADVWWKNPAFTDLS